MTDETETRIELLLQIRAEGSADDAVERFLANSDDIEASIWRPEETPEGPDRDGYFTFLCKAEVQADNFVDADARISRSSENVQAEITPLAL